MWNAVDYGYRMTEKRGTEHGEISCESVIGVMTRNLCGLCALCVGEMTMHLWGYSETGRPEEILFASLYLKKAISVVHEGGRYWAPCGITDGDTATFEETWYGLSSGKTGYGQLAKYMEKAVRLLWFALAFPLRGPLFHEQEMGEALIILERAANTVYGLPLFKKCVRLT